MNEKHDDQPIARGAMLPWAWDWSDWLLSGDTITAQEFAATDGLTIGDASQAAGVVTAEVTCDPDATIGSRQRATCTITTAAGLVDSRSIRYVVEAR